MFNNLFYMKLLYKVHLPRTSTQNNFLHILSSFQVGWNMYIWWNLYSLFCYSLFSYKYHSFFLVTINCWYKQFIKMLNSSFLKVSFYCINCAEFLVLSHSNPLRLNPACQWPVCTCFHVHAGDWRFCVLCNSNQLVAQWHHYHWEVTICCCWRIVP
jgi:hypothetical protein